MSNHNQAPRPTGEANSSPGNGEAICENIYSPPLGHADSKVLGILGSVGRGPGLMPSENPLNVRGNQHGIRSGWFNWPVNFDPVWLENCDGFECKQSEELE